MKTRLKVQGIVAVIVALGCYGDAAVDIGIQFGDQDLSASVEGLCEVQMCREGESCTVVYHPEFLGVPVAHCVSSEQSATDKVDPNACVEFKVGTNVMRCKTEDEWRNIGKTQCALKGNGERPLQSNMQLEHACHRFDQSSDAVFLQARFTCCPWLPQPTTQEVQEEEEAEAESVAQVNNEQTGQQKNKTYIIMYPAIVSMAIIISFIIILVAVWQRRRSVRQIKHPKVTIVTSFVNPSADHEATPTYDVWDEYSGKSDKSLLVVNEHTQFSPFN